MRSRLKLRSPTAPARSTAGRRRRDRGCGRGRPAPRAPSTARRARCGRPRRRRRSRAAPGRRCRGCTRRSPRRPGWRGISASTAMRSAAGTSDGVPPPKKTERGGGELTVGDRPTDVGAQGVEVGVGQVGRGRSRWRTRSSRSDARRTGCGGRRRKPRAQCALGGAPVRPPSGVATGDRHCPCPRPRSSRRSVAESTPTPRMQAMARRSSLRMVSTRPLKSWRCTWIIVR